MMKDSYLKIFLCVAIFLSSLLNGYGISITTITAINPAVAYRGGLVTFSGNNLSVVSAIKLNSTSINTSYIQSTAASSFVLEIPKIADGNYWVVITTPGGVVTAPGMLTVTVNSAILPVFSTVDPAIAQADDYVTITGYNLESLTGVLFGASAADFNTFVSIDGISFSIQVPRIPQATCQLSGVNEEGPGPGIPITIVGPGLISVSPAANEIDKIVTVSGIRLYSVISVAFGGVQADMNTFTKISDEQFSITVPYVAQVGAYSIVAYTGFDHTNAIGFSVSGLNIPYVTAVVPSDGVAVGDRITLEGGNLTNIIGVTFGNAVADASSIVSFAETSLSVLVPFIPSGENDVVVYTKRGSSAPFYFSLGLPLPQIYSFAPASVKIGDVLSIFGSNLASAKSLIINTFTTSGVTIVSQDAITAVVPNGATTGAISVITSYGMATSSATLTVDTVTSIRETVTLTGIANSGIDASLTVYPNPSEGLVYFAGYAGMAAAEIAVLNNVGKTVYSGGIGQNAILDITYLADGIYVLVVQNGNEIFRRKMVLLKSATR